NRPDLAYAVRRLSRYTSNPSYAHWKAITRVLHYLRYSRDYGLHYDKHHAVIEGYSDANWISDIKDSRSTSGYVFTLGGAAISWKSSKQTVIAKSIMESEFIALDKCGEEAEWLRQFVEDIPRWPKLVTAISIHCYVYLLKSKGEAIDKFVIYKTKVENQLGKKIKQNGIAERENRTLKEMVTAMLISSGMSQDMWGEAILTATYLLNKIPRFVE
ncbi:zinc finger, CCHC-type containing protein, partial [Tanacetum coccineum]